MKSLKFREFIFLRSSFVVVNTREVLQGNSVLTNLTLLMFASE